MRARQRTPLTLPHRTTVSRSGLHTASSDPAANSLANVLASKRRRSMALLGPLHGLLVDG